MYDPAQLHQQIIQSAAQGILVLDRELRCVVWNAQMEQFTGIAAGDLLGQPVVGRVAILSDPSVVPLLERALAGERLTSPDVIDATARSGPRWLACQLSPLREGAGAIAGVVIVVADITERKRAEQPLADSETRLRAILESEPECVKLIGAGGILLEMNPAGLAMIEADSPEQAIGLSVYPLVAPEHRDAFVALTDRVLAGGTGELEFDLVGLKGTRRRLETRAVPLLNAQRQVVAALGVTRDITRQTLALEALRDSEERFRQLAESIPEVFWLSDAASNRILYVSPAFEAVWGRSRWPLSDLPRVWMESVHPDDRPGLTAALSGSPPAHGEFEYRIVRPDGKIRLIRSQVAPVHDAAGRLHRIAGLAEDITARRDLEAQLRQTQKLESIGLLAGGIAHDFNNILTVIAGNSEIIEATLGPVHGAAPFVADIRAATERAASLTRQLLTFSRRQVLEPRVLDLNAVVAETEKMLRRLIGEHIQLAVELDAAGTAVKADPGSLVQVLMNLVVNARDAMPGGGRLVIATSDVELDEAGARARALLPGRYATLSVTDAGGGMTPEVRSRLFEPFFSTKGVNEGTGLGLAVVHGIVTQSGGAIEVESELNRGSRFTIFLPAASEVVSRPRDLVVGDTRGTETVLLAEDEPSVRTLAIRALEQQGYTVIEAADGREALRLAEAYHSVIDLLVTDVVMPGMGGRELGDALRVRFPDVKVLYTSGYTDDGVVRHGVMLSDVAFLQKPYTPRTLLHKCREALQQV